MSKILKIFFISMMIFSTIIIAGCGEEKKYNNFKNEFIKIQQEWESVEPTNENVDKHNEIAKKLDEKISEMEKVSKSEMKLNNDLLDLKKKYKGKSDVWESQLREKNALDKMHKEVTKYAPIIDDPWSSVKK